MILKLYILMNCTVILLAHQRTPTEDCCEYYCYDLDNIKPQFGHFGTYTAYPNVKDSDFRRHLVPNCHPIKIWFLNRHSTRYPSEKAMNKSMSLYELRDKIIENYEKEQYANMLTPQRGRLCNVDLELLKNWEWDPSVTLNNASKLAPQGVFESKKLAHQFKKLFPTLFDKVYTETNYLLAYTIDERVVGSFVAFVDGLFGPNSTQKYNMPEGRDKDMLLQAYEFCEASREQSVKIFEKGSQLTKYQKSDIYKKMVKEVSWRLGFSTPLKKGTITLMWNMCRYDQSWHIERPSPWCAVFTPAHIDILEYGEDIQFYYRKSYGSELNKKLACTIVSDMMMHLDSLDSPKAIIYFTHSTLIYLILTFMGAFRDERPLFYHNYRDMRHRQFHSSKICPFGANLAAIKYDCPNDIDERYKIMFLLNQQPLQLEWCENGLCKWSDILNMYGKYMSINCEEYFCSGSKDHPKMATFIWIVMNYKIWFFDL